MRLEALGSLRVRFADEWVRLRPAHRRLIASLLLDPGSWVGTDTMIDRMWGESPPPTARSSLHVHFSAVRRLVPGLVVTGQGAYRAEIDDTSFDVTEFTALVADATDRLERGHLRDAGDLASRALRLWRGTPYTELDDVDAALADRARLVEQFNAASVTLARALMLQGRASESITHLRAMVVEHPFAEHMWEELIHAYYLAGRQADALAAYGEAKRVLGEELGLEPGPRLQALEERVLLQDPELISIPGRGHNLPSTESTFVGREADLAGVLGLLDESHLVTITGGPGMGKTRLATEVAASVVEDFPDGVWLARLSGATNQDDLLATVAAAMDIPDPGTDPGELYERLASMHALLVLDNCEQILPAVRQLLTKRPSSGRLRVLATSRQRIGATDEAVWPLRELAFPDRDDEIWDAPTVRLLVDRIRTADPKFDVDTLDTEAVIELCRRTGGVPLALELAARWVPAMGVARVASLILGPPPVPHEPDPPHHVSLHAAIEWSIGLLDDSARVAFEAAAWFAAPFSALAFTEVCTPRISEEKNAAVLGALVEASLVIAEADARGDVTYRVLEPLQEHGRARLASSRRTRSVADRHASWFHGAALEIGSLTHGRGEAKAWSRAQDQLPDLRKAMRHLLDRGRTTEATEMAIGLTDFWIGAYLGWEGKRWLDECLAHVTDAELRLQALSAAGNISFYIGAYDESAAAYIELGDLAATMGDTARQAEAQYGEGRVELHRRPEQGARLIEKAMDAFERTDNTIRVVEARLNLAIQAAYGARLDEAESLLIASLADLDAVPSSKLAAIAHRYLALVAWYRDDEHAARAHIERAETLALETRDDRVISGVLSQQAWVEGKWGKPDQAARATLESLELTSSQHGIYFCLVAFGALPALIASEEWDVAARLFDHFDRTYRKYGWIDLDRRVAAAPGFRVEVAQGLARSGTSPVHIPMTTAEMSAELMATLKRISGKKARAGAG